jgi:hypothetical protein
MNLRRVLTALAILAVFTAVASAQITSNQVTCTVAPASTPTIRSEGVTERVGDVLITCINGLQLNSGNAADRITITVNYNAPITNSSDGVTKNSDIMLAIDEPNSMSLAAASELGIAGYGPNAPITGVCTVPNQTPLNAANQLANCPAYSLITGSPAVYYATSATGAAGSANAINVYQGAIGASGTSVTFANVPFVPPYVNTAGQGTLVSRVYRVMDVRVNPNGQSAISATVAQPVVNANDVSTFNAIQSPTVSVANVQPSIATAVNNASSALSVCVQTALTPAAGQPQLNANAAYLTFAQGFASAFKTRVVSVSSADNATSAGAVLLQLPTQPVNGTYNGGAISNTAGESGVLIPITGTSAVAGLANSGTRLKAVFSNLDPGAKYYVSLNNITDFTDLVKQPAVAPGDTSAVPFAVLQTQGTEIAGYVQSTDAAGSVAIKAPAVPVVQLNVNAKGAAEAVWEITNIDGTKGTYTFAVYAVFPPNVVNPSPATAATVQLGYAPTNGTANTNPVGVTTTWVPRFSAPGAGVPLLQLLPCRTTMLFPFVSSSLAAPGMAWQTGVAIENTGADPLGTQGTSGPCTLSFYGANAPPSITVGPVAPGGSYNFLVSDPAQVGATTNWTGYIFAVCNFNYGHGFVFIEDPTRMMAMGYVGQVLNVQTSSVPRGSFTLGESLGH